MELLTKIQSEMSVMTNWEALAVILAVAYLVLAMKQNIWCWAAAFSSSLIFTIIFWKVSLLMDSILNFYYIAMAVYGYWMWTKGGNNSHGVKVVSWSKQRHLAIIATTTVVSLILGYFMANHTHASYPYLDTATTCFAIVTTYLVAKKVLENWLYWLVINSVSLYLYINKELMLTSVLFGLYLVLAIIGYKQWRDSMKQNSINNKTESLT
ncbi:nicotinamide riboside transporter PnuC [Parashewanella curva]|uniref:Nicotinamide riboside transporter PnuC n=1 Tax=Parashewanella curva TaxID=2338552 RepID=A0A3L8PSW7_9GAMM|nr:nicotinamide riboside transporter PnuC [Parashewanella curva]RLV58491.1 nicotinamide riboside transporter PnuC [Parashewanella curva]